MYKTRVIVSLSFEICKTWEKTELQVLMVMEIFLSSYYPPIVVVASDIDPKRNGCSMLMKECSCKHHFLIFVHGSP